MLINRLPGTISASIKEQLARRAFLFPVELRLLDARLEWLEQLNRAEFDRLFAPVNAIEARIALPPLSKDDGCFSIERTVPKKKKTKKAKASKDDGCFSIERTATLARSPLYPDWRREVERAFATIDAGAEKLHPPAQVARVLFCILPAGLPASPDPWRDTVPDGARVTFEHQFGEFQGDLLTAIAHRECPSALTPIENMWVVPCDAQPYLNLAAATVVSWDDTARLRREFLGQLNTIEKTLHSVDETMSRLQRMDLAALLPARLTGDPRLREFVRSLLLSGNGSLVINNSFVQWCASETLRRAQPQVLVAAFGIRDRPKPFSSLVWFEDQARANPMPDQPDPEGSLVDGAMLSRYVYLTARRLAPYTGHTMAWFTAADRKSAVFVAPDQKLNWVPRNDRPVSASEVLESCLNWLR